jgi:ligand-binding sensor domain-containing protein
MRCRTAIRDRLESGDRFINQSPICSILKPTLGRLVLLFVLSAILSPGAAPPSFRIFTTQDGLVRNWVTKIHRDSQGYLWFCTVEGISLFDGYRFTNFSTRDGLPSRLVLDMIETAQGDFWFATDAGLARFHRNHGNGAVFDTVRVGDSKESNEVRELYESHDGTIWCGTAAGLYSFRPQDGEPGPRATPLNGSGAPEVQALAEDSRRNLWVATPQALFRRRPNGEVDFLHIRIPIARINSMLVDGHDRLWVGSYGLVGIDTKTEPPRLLPPADIPDKTPALINVLYPGDRGEIWIGKSTGLVRFRPDASPPDVPVYKPSDAFPIAHVGAIGQDVRHNLWLAVGTRGVVRIAAGAFELFTRAGFGDRRESCGRPVDNLGSYLDAV